MTIDLMGPVPLYRQLAEIIRARINDGTYPPDRAIPSLLKLAEEFGIAEITVRKAVAVLTREGLLTAVPGRGTFVRRPGAS